MERRRIEDVVAAAASEIRTWHAVAIVGAGASLSRGYPLIGNLDTLLWHALDTDLEQRDALAHRYGRAAVPAKELLVDEYIKRDALEIVKQSPIARRAYQETFARLDAERAEGPSAMHNALAELLHRGYVETVISFNWDTLLEKAYRRLYGRALRAGEPWLYKPHGDAAQPNRDWVLPHEAGFVPPEILRAIGELVSNHPRALLIVGYSERDEEVVQRLIAPLSARWHVIRVGPSAAGPLSIALPAEQALPRLLRAITPSPEVPGWEYVRFDTETPHDLGDALAGRPLGPEDVDICPRLREVSVVRSMLDATNSAVIMGPSGCGKSITAYQVAHDLSREGWEVLRLADTGTHDLSSDDLIQAVESLPRPSVLVVDGAPAIVSRVSRRLRGKASESLQVIVVETADGLPQGDAVVLDNRQAVDTIARELLRRRAETVAAVRKFDVGIGDAPFQEPLETRVRSASESILPWQFCFVLTGGWQRARREMALFYDQERADLLLVAIAARQFVTQDTGADRLWLEQVALVLEYGPSWLDSGLALLRGRRLLMGTTAVRCPHLQLARVVLSVACSAPDEPEWNLVLRLLRLTIHDDTATLRGIAWLLHHLRFTDGFRSHGRSSTIVDEATWRYLTRRCWAASTATERGDAALALNALRDWYPDHHAHLADHATQLGAWVAAVDADSAVGLGRLLNDVHNDDQALAERICDHVDPAIVAASVTRATWAEAGAWGWFLGRLSVAASRSWGRHFVTSVDATALQALGGIATPGDLRAISALAQGLLAFDGRLSIELVESCVATIAMAFSRAPGETYGIVQELVMLILDHMPRTLVPFGTTDHQHIGDRLLHGIAPAAIAHFVSHSRSHEWGIAAMILNFLDEHAPDVADDIVAHINLDALDEATDGAWERMPAGLRDLIWVLATGSRASRGRAWAERHVGDVARLSPILAILAPGVACARVRAGCPLDLMPPDVDEESWGPWGDIVDALAALTAVDRDVTIRVVSDNAPRIAARLSSLDVRESRGVAAFLSAMQTIDPALLSHILSLIDVSIARDTWPERLRRDDEGRAAVHAMCGAIISRSVPQALQTLAAHLDSYRADTTP